MTRFVAQLIPMITAMVLSRGALRISLDRWSLAAIGAGLAALVVSRVPAAPHRYLVAAAFGFGALGLVRALLISTRARWLVAVAAIGCGCNLAPIIAYGAMPVRSESRRLISPTEIAEPPAFALKHVEVHTGSAMAALGDTMAISPIRSVVSVGDLLILGAVIGIGVRNRRRVTPSRSTSAGSPTGRGRSAHAAPWPTPSTAGRCA